MTMIRDEFTIDDDRTYLMGHSMGGAGALFLGQRYADEWAASMETVGIEGEYIEMPEGDHGSVINDGMPAIFELFEENTR